MWNSPKIPKKSSQNSQKVAQNGHFPFFSYSSWLLIIRSSIFWHYKSIGEKESQASDPWFIAFSREAKKYGEERKKAFLTYASIHEFISIKKSGFSVYLKKIHAENYSKYRIWIFNFWHFSSIFVLLKVSCLVTLFDHKLLKYHD